NGTVAVAAGTYVENVQLSSDHSGVHLAGRCRELVIIDASEGSEEDYTLGSGIHLRGALTTTWTVSGVTTTGAPYNGIVQVSGNLTLDGVSSVENEARGLATEYGRMEATNCEVRDNGTYGVYAWAATSTLTDCLVQGNHQYGLYSDGSAVSLERVEILRTQSHEGSDGFGLKVLNQSDLVVVDSIVEGNRQLGMLLAEDCTATLTGVQLLDTLALDSGEFGRGIQVSEGSTLVMTDCVVAGNEENALVVWESTAELNSTVVQDNRLVGLYILDAALTLNQAQVLDTLPGQNGGRGIQAFGGSTLVAVDSVVERNRGIALVVDHSSADLEGCRIADTGRDTVGSAAVGLVVQYGTVTATGLSIENTDGPGIYATSSSQISGTGCVISGSAFAGVVVRTGTDLHLTDSEITGTRASSNEGGGLGVFVDDDDHELGLPVLTLQDSTIRDNPMGAVYLRGAGTFQLTGNDLSGGTGIETPPGSWSHGDAVFVTVGETVTTGWNEDEQVGLLLEDNLLSDSMGSGLFLNGTSATLLGNTYQSNTTDLVRQACTGAEAPEGLAEEPLSSTELCPEYDYPTQDLEMTAYLVEADADI
ncbi:MAG: right-handed parallel beta-helix repeat-containing protein, partial [Myxococcota bacterium]|nr:right-handed parallel beta-helix repeat-containing protein [Myxococcota bacterium]